MNKDGSRGAILAAALIVLAGGAGTETTAQYARRTPIVDAVKKTKAGIVTIVAQKKNSWGQNKENVGTGVVVDERGYVVTNRHLVVSSSSVTVTLADDTDLTAQVLFEDASNDLAILKVKSDQSLQALPLGPSSDLMVGETVIAVGHPFGYTNTVSTGIVSALNREIPSPAGGTMSGLIQTDASINPGNSGGPLLNINGELIGLNVALREGARGIAFAIPADIIKSVLAKQLSGEKVAGVRHGLACSELVQEEGRARQKLVVKEIGKTSPASAAGLQPGDEIETVAGKAVVNPFDLERALWDRKPGESVQLTYVREGKKLTATMKLAHGSRNDNLALDAPKKRGRTSEEQIQKVTRQP